MQVRHTATHEVSPPLTKARGLRYAHGAAGCGRRYPGTAPRTPITPPTINGFTTSRRLRMRSIVQTPPLYEAKKPPTDNADAAPLRRMTWSPPFVSPAWKAVPDDIIAPIAPPKMHPSIAAPTVTARHDRCRFCGASSGGATALMTRNLCRSIRVSLIEQIRTIPQLSLRSPTGCHFWITWGGRGTWYATKSMSSSRLTLCIALLFSSGATAASTTRGSTAVGLSGAGTTLDDAEANARQAEATIQQVETDIGKMASFAEEVQRTLRAEEEAKADVAHAIGYFRRQIELSTDERDLARTHLQRVESEVSSLQRQVKQLEQQLDSCKVDKKALTEANKKVIGQLSSVFKFGQQVETGLAINGLVGDTNTTA